MASPTTLGGCGSRRSYLKGCITAFDCYCSNSVIHVFNIINGYITVRLYNYSVFDTENYLE